MIKALLVIMTMTGSEYNVNMPDMKTCMEQAKIVSSQDEDIRTLCIPRADKSARVREFFDLFGNMVEEFQFDGESYSKCGGRLRSDAPYNEFTKGYGQLCRE